MEGETPEECLRRELFEELGVEVEIERALPLVIHRYRDYSITLYPFLCRMDPLSEITLNEHDRAAWVLPEDLCVIDWAEADVGVMKNYLEHTACPRKDRGKSRGTR